MTLLRHTILLTITPLLTAQVNVHIDATKPINVITTASLGVYTDIYDTAALQPAVAPYLHAAGISIIAFPGGYGSYPDLYHWYDASGSKYQNFTKQDHFYPSENNMAHLVPALDKIGSAVLTINYGSNLAGTGPGEPAEAAAWVAYMNGDPANPQIIGKDSTEKDWKTVGYWATLRASAPLPTDDGLNMLRANHPRPLNIKLWQIGNQIYNNGFYPGNDHRAEQDLHAPYAATEGGADKRAHNPSLSPTFYGQRVADFAKAMKAVDPKLWVGATLTTAPIDNFAPDWNPEVLKSACASIDFAAFNWTPDHRNNVDPYNIRDDAATLQSPETEIGPILKEALYDFKKFCPAGHEPRVAFTQMFPVRWAKIGSRVADGLFAADAMALFVETGTINTDWSELHDDFFLSASNTPGPAFYGIQMLHLIAFNPGDPLLTTSSSNALVAAHASLRNNGTFGVMLINKDPAAPVTIKLTIEGANFALAGTRFDYGATNFADAKPISKSPFTAPSTTAITVTVPPYTITDLIFPKPKTTP